MGKELEATPEDVRHAYRLFLGREPDAVGFEFNCDAVRRDKLSAIELGRRFLGSEERSYRNQPNGLLREVEIEGVKLYPWEGDQLIGDHFSEDLGYESNVLPVFLEAL